MNVLLLNEPCEISSENPARFEYQAESKFFPLLMGQGVECSTKQLNTRIQQRGSPKPHSVIDDDNF